MECGPEGRGRPTSMLLTTCLLCGTCGTGIGLHLDRGRCHQVYSHTSGKAGNGTAQRETGTIQRIYIATYFGDICHTVHYGQYTVSVAHGADDITAVVGIMHVQYTSDHLLRCSNRLLYLFLLR